jgi:hypothetical protein
MWATNIFFCRASFQDAYVVVCAPSSSSIRQSIYIFCVDICLFQVVCARMHGCANQKFAVHKLRHTCQSLRVLCMHVCVHACIYLQKERREAAIHAEYAEDILKTGCFLYMSVSVFFFYIPHAQGGHQAREAVPKKQQIIRCCSSVHVHIFANTMLKYPRNFFHAMKDPAYHVDVILICSMLHCADATFGVHAGKSAV